jgi:competence protein ComEC
VEVGDVLYVVARLNKPRNTKEFDAVTYFKAQQIFLEGRAVHAQRVRKENNIATVAAVTRRWIRESLFKNLTYNQAALLAGLLIGSKEKFADGFSAMLENTGTTHIIAVSGSNVAMLAAMLMQLSGLIGRKKLLIVLYLAMIFFNFLVGVENIPASRAVIMACVLITSWQIGKPYLTGIVLLIAIALLLLINPYVWMSVSFQLSISALVGIVFLAPTLTVGFRHAGIFKENLATSLAATLTTLPILLAVFGKFSLMSVVANCLVLPLIPYATIGGIVSNIAYLLRIPASQLLFYSSGLLLDLVINIITALGKDAVGLIDTKQQVIIIYLLLIAFYVVVDYRQMAKKNHF